MLSYLVIFSSSVTAVYKEVIADIQCKIHLSNLEEYLKQQRQDIITNIHVSMVVQLLLLIYLCWKNKIQHSM